MYNVYYADREGKHLVQRTDNLIAARETEDWIRSELRKIDPELLEHNSFTISDEEIEETEAAKKRWDALSDEEKETFIIVDGKKYVKAIYEQNHQLTIKQMREYLGLNKAQFSRKYDIPARTLDAWESGERTPAPYVLKLLERAVKEDKR